MYDNELNPQPKTPQSITMVSATGVDLQPGSPDFTIQGGVVKTPHLDNEFVQFNFNEQTKKIVVKGLQHNKEGLLLERIEMILHHVFRCFEQAGCRRPVLSAIGCGVFAYGIREVPGVYARAMARLLSRHTYGFDVVLLPLLVHVHVHAFRTEWAKHSEHLRVPLVVLFHRSAMTLADHLSRYADGAVGLLNPSDPAALRGGYVGMHFDGGPYALEELMALQTTMLLHHRGSNPSFYKRHQVVTE